MATPRGISESFPSPDMETPREVTQVVGCDCGGLDWHLAKDIYSGQPGCSIWSVPVDQRKAAVDDAHSRIREFTAGLTAQLRAVQP
jgi:hypothetical protein